MIETKFNVGDEVWVIHSNKVSTYQVRGIHVFCSNNCIEISYVTEASVPHPENKLFATKDELLKSL